LPGQLIREWETLGLGKTMLESRQSNPLTHNCRPGEKPGGKQQESCFCPRNIWLNCGQVINMSRVKTFGCQEVSTVVCGRKPQKKTN